MAIDSIGSAGNSPSAPAAPQGGGLVQAMPAFVESPAPAPQQQPTMKEVQQAVKAVQHFVEPMTSNSLQFELDSTSGKMVVRITDSQTGEVIRQIPSKEMLEIAQSLDRMQGLLLKQKA
jgi:flagellar protein FlaG